MRMFQAVSVLELLPSVRGSYLPRNSDESVPEQFVNGMCCGAVSKWYVAVMSVLGSKKTHSLQMNN